MDKNGDGKLSKNELFEGYKELQTNMTDDEFNNLMKFLDNDNNGFIEYEEFIRASFDRKKLLSENNLKIAFDMLDVDKCGRISCQELKKIIFGDNNVSQVLMSDFFALINKHDTDLITFDEFKEEMQKVII